MDHHEADDAEAGTGVYVTELGPDDVLLGRGTGPSSNEGNVNFRVAVGAIKAEYVSTPSRKAKNKLVRKAVEAIKAKNGRFLSKLRKSEIKMLGMSAHKAVYEVVKDSVAFEKTKQAIRYVHYKKDANVGSKGPDHASTAQDSSSDDDDDVDSKSRSSSQSPLKKKAKIQASKSITGNGNRNKESKGNSQHLAASSDSSGKNKDEHIALLGRGSSTTANGSSLGGGSGGALAQIRMSPGLAGGIANLSPAAAAQQNNFSASLHHILSESLNQNAASAPGASQASAGGLSLGPTGGYSFLGFQSLHQMAPPNNLHAANTGLMNSLLGQTDSSSGTAHSNSADPTQANRLQQGIVPPSASNIYSMLLSQSLSAGGPRTLAQSAGGQYGNIVTTNNRASNVTQQQLEDQQQQGATSGLFQQALQNEQLRAVLLSDERYRHIIESLMPQNRFPPSGS